MHNKLIILCVCITTGNTCTVGSVYDDYDEVNSPGGWWYLNLKKPNSCSGSISHYDLDHYDLEERWYGIKVALWTPVDNDTYQMVS